MSDIVRYRPGQIEAAVSTLSGNLNTIKQQTEDRINTGNQYVQTNQGQFIERFNELNQEYARVTEEVHQTINHIISAVTEAKASNAARDLRSASSIG
ncbi:hypothetical protein ACT17_11580 [Mycolicibacterium conceptionense]|jgi:uncharacterized protein YukE|uniref:ESAT-6-like protein n=1 Tax=Mycolicibacterium conceptionense TaxID=451644 RepID=A0A0J8U9N8_9MYCO|nr:hypothetical protein [Mycolicibacterium conceptionense]KMV18273.1 hypothetical protein ACT17_11580 [Mycolicibacterium conceptionense]